MLFNKLEYEKKSGRWSSMDEANFKKNYSMQTLHRAAQVLKSFTNERKLLSLTDLNKITEINTSSLQRLLSTLEFEGLLARDKQTKLYQLGLGLLFMGELVEKNSTLLSLARPVMENLNQITTETISLNIVEGRERKCLYNLKSNHGVTASIYVGNTAPLYAGASAKVLLANFTDIDLQNYLNEIEFEKITGKTIVKTEELLLDLENIRKQGYGVSYGERVKGATSVSAPIFNPSLEVLASITITIPDARVNDYSLELLAKNLLEGAREISNKLRV